MKHIFLGFLLFLSLSLRGQTIEAGVYGGFSYYDGDLGPNELDLYFQTLHPAGGFLLRANVARWLSFRLGYTHMTISGDDAISNRARSLNFKTTINEVALSGELNLFRLHLFGNDFYAEPYLYGGAAVYHFRPTAEYQGERVELQPLGTEAQGLPGYEEKYQLWDWSLLGGGGVKLRLSDRVILGLEASGRVTFNDYLDDVSNTQVTYQDVLEGNGTLAAELSQPTFDPDRGDPTRPYVRGGEANDYVFTVGATLTYVFGSGNQYGSSRSWSRCPTF